MLVYVVDYFFYFYRFFIYLVIKYGRKKLDIDLFFGFNIYEFFLEDFLVFFVV